MKKSISIFLTLFLCVAMVLAGCGNKETSKQGESGSGEKVTLNVAVWSEPAKEYLEKTLELYKKDNPDVEVILTVTPWKDYWSKLQTSLAGQGGPDVFWMNGPNFYKYASLGLIQDLQSKIEEEKIDMNAYTPTMNELYSYEGKMYAMPSYLDSVALFYNKEIFDQAGIPYPDKTWTWEKLEETARKLTNKEKGIYGFIAPNDNSYGYYPIIHQAGGYIIDEDKTKSGFDSAGTQAGLQWMKDLMDEGISPTAQMQMENEPQQMFGSGLAAMLPIFSPRASILHDMLGDKLGVTELPKGKEKATVVHGIGWALNKNTKHEEEAWELLKVLSGEQAGTIIAESAFSIPAYEAAQETWLKSIPSIDLQVFLDSLQFAKAYPISKNTAEWQTIEMKEVTDFFLGKKSVEEATKTIADEMNKILKEENK